MKAGRVGGTLRGLLVLAVALVPATAGAQTLADYDYENLQFRALGVDAGWVWPAQVEPAFAIGVRADLGYLGPHIRAMPSAHFWSSSLRQREVDRLATQILEVCARQQGAVCPSGLDLGEIRRSDLALNADVHYVLDQFDLVTPYAGGGLSLHLLNGRGELIDGTFIEDLLDTIVPGVDVVGGFQAPLAPSLRLLAEARLVVTSDVRYGGVSVGGSWTLPTPRRAPAP